MPVITNLLLTLPRLGNTYLSRLSYSVMADVFSVSIEDDSTHIGEYLPEVLKVVLSFPPTSDFLLSASWVQVLSGALVAFNTVNQNSASLEVGSVWKAVWKFLDSPDANSRKASAQSLSAISTCFSPKLISAAIADQENTTLLRKIILQVTKALDSLSYAQAIPELLSVISSIIMNLKYRETKTAPTAAETLVIPLVVRIADLRISKGFEYKEAADATLSVAMRVMGPEVLLKALPLNLEPGNRYVL